MLDDVIKFCLSNGKVDYANFLKKFRNTDSDFGYLHSLVKSDEWPLAIHPIWLCDQFSEDDKFTRASDAISLVVKEELTGKSFLDFGCGEGHFVEIASKLGASVSVGYDPNSDYKTFANSFISHKWGDIKIRGPFDVILLYDVLDHCRDHLDALAKVKDVLSPSGTVYVRNHPWTSRHSTHLYRQLNKAYIHLVFSEEELSLLGISAPSEHTHRITHPINTYKKWFETSGFQINEFTIISENVEEFFKKEPIKSRITAHWKKSQPNVFPEFQMKQQFIDYILKHA